MEGKFYEKIFYISSEKLRKIQKECEKISQAIEQLERKEQKKIERTLDIYQKARKEWEKQPWYKKIFTNPPEKPYISLILLPDNLRRSISFIEVTYLRPFKEIDNLPEEIFNALNDISRIFGVEKLVEKTKEAWEQRHFYDADETFRFSLKTNLPYFEIIVHGSSSRWGQELIDFGVYLSSEVALEPFHNYEGG